MQIMSCTVEVRMGSTALNSEAETTESHLFGYEWK